jgi:hypothetical protein
MAVEGYIVQALTVISKERCMFYEPRLGHGLPPPRSVQGNHRSTANRLDLNARPRGTSKFGAVQLLQCRTFASTMLAFTSETMKTALGMR